MKKCKKHVWLPVTSSSHYTEIDIEPGAINLYFAISELKVCMHCFKVKGYFKNPTNDEIEKGD